MTAHGSREEVRGPKTQWDAQVCDWELEFGRRNLPNAEPFAGIIQNLDKPVGDMVHLLTNSIRPLCFHVYIVNHLC